MSYWIFEYGKVLIAYIFVMFIWPSAVFSKYLKGKSYGYRFAFCTTTSIVLINTVILLLGLLHILNPWVVRIIFYGTLAVAIYKQLYAHRDKIICLKYFCTGVYSFKRFLSVLVQGIVNWMKRFCCNVWKKICPHMMEYGVLFALLVFSMVFFSYGVFQDHSYGFTDMYTHHSWIYQLTQGNVFSSGVYPEAMHCFVYSINTLFGINVYSCMLFLGCIHVITYLAAAYLYFKEIFNWKYCALMVITLFLILDVDCVYQVFSVSRLQYTLPQEFAYFTIFLCGAYLLKYLKSDSVLIKIGAKKNLGYDENLLIFVLALAVSIASHFYVTIFAFFLCLGIAVFYVGKIFRKKYFVPLLTSVFIGVAIAVAPMAGALLSGIQFQGSIGWALGVIEGRDMDDGVIEESDEESKDEISTTVNLENATDSMQEKESQEPLNAVESGVTDEMPEIPVNVEQSEIKENNEAEISSTDDLEKELSEEQSILKKIYKSSLAELYYPKRSKILSVFGIIGLLVGALYELIKHICIKKGKMGVTEVGYLPLMFSVCFFVILYAAPGIGLPELVAKVRICNVLHFLLIGSTMVLADLYFGLLSLHGMHRKLLEILSVISCLVIYGVSMEQGFFRGFLYCELTRYNAAVEQTVEIVNSMPKESYTIVSTTDELYQVIGNGFHEEAQKFLKKSSGEHYTLPTEYVFIYVEKQPLKRAQCNFFEGPAWLGAEKYLDMYEAFGSRGEDIICSEISEEEAQKELEYVMNHSVYQNFEKRTILQSKLYEWCRRFEELYPYEMNVVYEDEAFICYAFQQNTYNLYELAIMNENI